MTSIQPDVVVDRVDGGYEVRLTRGRVPELQVSPNYRQLLEGTKRGDSVQQWVKRRIESARWFVDAVQQRQNTMYDIAKATSVDELKGAMAPLSWAVDRAHDSGVMAEQYHPYSGDPISVSPLTWSHSTFVVTCLQYLTKLEALSKAPNDSPAAI